MRRVLAGEIDVTLFGLGGLVEKVVVSNIEKSYDDAAAFTARWIAAYGVTFMDRLRSAGR